MVNALFSTESYLVAKKLLDASALRHDAIASNIANVETPGYKRVDVDMAFDTQLKNAVRKNDIQMIQELSPSLSEDKAATASRIDGNNVKLESEMMADNKNSVEYDFLTQYLSSNLQQLTAAMKSGGN